MKSNVGHSESASGITALIKVLLMMKANTIPPNCGIKTKINHDFPTDLVERNLHIPRTSTSWKVQVGKPRVAIVENFSAAGGNSAVLLQDGDASTTDPIDDARLSHAVTIPAESAASLEKNIQATLRWLQDNPNV